MRATLTAALFLALGALAMSAAVADDTKPKDPSKEESFDLTLTVRYWNGKQFIKPVEGVKAFKFEKDGVVKYWTKSSPATFGNPDKKSELIVGDDTWVVTDVSKGGTFTVCTVKAKPK